MQTYLNLLVVCVSVLQVQGLKYGPPAQLLGHPLQEMTVYRKGMSGAASNIFPEVLASYQFPQMGMYDPKTLPILEDVKEGLRYLFQTNNTWTYPVAGTGHSGIEAVLDNVIEPGDVVLIPIYGIWAQRAMSMATRLGAKVPIVEKPFGQTFTLEEIEAAIIQHKPKIVYLTHVESSVGAYQSVQGVGPICRKNDCLLLVDNVGAAGIIPFHMDEWEVDATWCNSQKGIGAAVGLAPISLGPRAIEKIKNRKTKTASYRNDFNLWDETNFWRMDHQRPPTLNGFMYSLPVLQIYGMRDALARLATEGIENSWTRHRDGTDRLYVGLDKLGLKYFVEDPKARAVGTIRVLLPENIKLAEVKKHALEKYNVELGAGFNYLGEIVETSLRFGLFGPNGNVESAEKALEAIQDIFAK